jgi:hypothetical protein
MTAPTPAATPAARDGGGGRWGDGFAADAAALVLGRLAVDALVVAVGFSHVSDDDFARTVIAEQLVHAPRLDPSGTSWLPLPFWVTGALMAVAGRSIEVARAASVVLGAVSVVAPYAAMRAVRVARTPAMAAAAVATLLPWGAWLGAAAVPEGWAGALAGAGAIAIGSARARPWAAAALLAASLSRYEAWPVCAIACAAWGWDAIADRDRDRRLLWALVAASGPLLWMAWNAHAHGSPLHFFARVSRFRRATGAAAVPLADKLLCYPIALARETPEIAVLGLIGVTGAALRADVRERWRWGLAGAAGVMVFLVAGDLGDGAPTHHPVRALAPAGWILAGAGLDAAWTAASAWSKSTARRTTGAALAAAAALAWVATLPARWRAAPGETEWDRRDAQIARGLDMRARRVTAAEVAPCSYEHFALLAAWGEPERAHVAKPTGEPPGPDCPRVVETATAPE